MFQVVQRLFQYSPYGRVADSKHRLFFEKCEDRRMLAAMADVVFLVDESQSTDDPSTNVPLVHSWLENAVPAIQSTFDSVGVDIDVTYGMVGFGEQDDNGTPTNLNDDTFRFAHSQLMGSGNLFTSELSELTFAINPGLADFGGFEDGWDALEHAIAEYDFRPGAVPVLVLVQNEEGRVPLSDTLTRDGIFAALRSKNANLNVMVAVTT